MAGKVLSKENGLNSGNLLESTLTKSVSKGWEIATPQYPGFSQLSYYLNVRGKKNSSFYSTEVFPQEV